MFPFLKKRKSEIKAVSDKEIESYLKSLGIIELVNSGEQKCSSCGKSVNIDSIQAIVPSGDEIKVLCNNSSCIKKLENGFS